MTPPGNSQQLCESSSPNTGNNSSQPEMTDMVDDSQGRLLADAAICTDPAPVVGMTLPLMDWGFGADIFPDSNNPISGFADPIPGPDDFQDAANFTSVSMFGSSIPSAVEGAVDFGHNNDLALGCNAGLATQSVTSGDTPGEPAQYCAGLTPPPTDHAPVRDEFHEDGFDYIAKHYDDDPAFAGYEEAEADELEDITIRLEEGDLDAQGLTKRVLRPQPSGCKRKFMSTWMDEDASGNYDPNAERKLQNAKRARKNATRRLQSVVPSDDVDEDETVGELTEKVSDDESSQSQAGLVTLTFSTEEGIEAFKDKLPSLAVQKAAQRRGLRLRARKEAEVQHSPAVELNFTNKPIARCCQSCVEDFGDEAAVVQGGTAMCSLAIDPAQRPCFLCLDNGLQCVLLTEPTSKLACDDCKASRVPCSYTSTRNHSGPCQRAASMKSHCLDLLANMTEVSTVEKAVTISTNRDNTNPISRSNAPWGLQRISATSKVGGSPSAMDYTYSFTDTSLGVGADIYMVDTGLFAAHNVFNGRAEMLWSFNGNEEDIDGHGTHVAGTAAGDILGVASNANIYGIKALDSDGGGSSSNVVAGIDFVVKRHDARKRAGGHFTGSIISMSLASSSPVQAINMAVDAAISNGVHVCVAAGNNGGDACTSSPASAGGASGRAITVGATGIDDRRASFSNYGDCVDIYGPGVGIVSAWIGQKNMVNSLSGTSMAAPHVTGIIAYAMANQTLADDPVLMKEWLLSAALPLTDGTLLANNGA